MPAPGTKVTDLDNPVIGFGGGGGPTVEKYGGYPYSLDFSLSLMDPSRITISFISEDRKYKTNELERDIIEVGTKGWAEQIQYCGGGDNTFYGYPLKYSINRSPRGDILTVDYYDASIVELDNCFVLLNGEDFPNVISSDAQEAGQVPFNFIAENPCQWGIFNLGSPFIRNTSGIPQSNPACVDETTQEFEVLYTNHELARKIEENIAVDPTTIQVLSPQKDGADSVEKTFLESYHGTLRDVLKQWGQRMGFTFYWDPKNTDGGGPGAGKRNAQGRLVFLDLKGGLFYEDLKRVADLMTGQTSGGACNLLDSTQTVSRDQTFNKAISARYENSGIGDAVHTDNMMILDLLTLPVRKCYTDVGREWDIDEYPRGIKTDGDAPGDKTGYEDGSPQWMWTDENSEWYKEWDSPNYSPDVGPDSKDKIERKWEEYQPERPPIALPGGGLDEVGREFRDYVRLVKAAAIGEDFFKAYIFFKMMKSSESKPDKTLADVMKENPTGTALDPKVMDCEQALEHLFTMGYQVEAGGKTFTGSTEADKNSAIKACCGEIADAPIETKLAEAEDAIVIYPENAAPNDDPGIKVNGGVPCTPNEDMPGFLVPDLVPNLALEKILKKTDNAPDPYTPNVKICRGTIVGADCLTVGVLDPCFKATRFLYTQSGGNPKAGCQKNEALSIDVVNDESRVFRLNIDNEDADKDADKEGSPFIFTYVYNYGNSMVLNDRKHAQLYSQLKYVAENAGRFYVSSEPLTEREYRRRNFDEEGMSWTNKLVDVNDTKLRGLFQTFDPIAPRSLAPFSHEGPPKYDQFWGEDFTKGDESTQKQLNGFDNLEPPENQANPCDYDNGDEFSPTNTQTGENTRAPNLEQMIEKIIDKNLSGNTGIPCSQNASMEDFFPNLTAATMDLNAESLIPVTNDQGEITGYKLKPIYNSPSDFSGGNGYGKQPEITFSGDGIDEGALSVKTIIENTVIKEIIIENTEDVEIKINPDTGQPDIQVEIEPPTGGLINFFKHLRFGPGSTEMDYMDSITSENLARRQEQRELACCCTDLEEGIVMHDSGELLVMDFNDKTRKQIERLSSATNLTIGSQFAGNLVKDYKRDNKVITLSTNLIPREELDDSISIDAEDELDWIVDQVKLGKAGADPAFGPSFNMPTTPIEDGEVGAPGLDGCYMHSTPVKYIVEGGNFKSVVFGIATDELNVGQGANALGQVVKTVPAGTGGNDLIGCEGWIGDMPGGFNVRQLMIDFESPTSEDIGIEFECGKEWVDLTEEEQRAKLLEIQDNLIRYVEKRAYAQNQTSYEASVTIADPQLLTKAGAPVNFGGEDEPAAGIPSIKQGLEALSIKVDGNGVRVVISLGTRKKLMGLRDSNTNLWKEINPRTLNQMQMNNPQQN